MGFVGIGLVLAAHLIPLSRINFVGGAWLTVLQKFYDVAVACPRTVLTETLLLCHQANCFKLSQSVVHRLKRDIAKLCQLFTRWKAAAAFFITVLDKATIDGERYGFQSKLKDAVADHEKVFVVRNCGDLLSI